MFTVYLKSAGGTKKYFTEFETEAEAESFCREYDNYVHSTKEIFLGEPSLEGFLHQFRHHLQNKAREPQYKYLLVENDPKADYRIPYKDCVYRMYGEDDARAWARMVIELAS